MAYRQKVVKLDRHTDGVSLSWDDVSYDGELDMSVSVYRGLKSGNTEETVYKFRMQPEDATCAIRTLKRAVQGSRNKMLERVQKLGEEM
jgi:hypothetical protein